MNIAQPTGGGKILQPPEAAVEYSVALKNPEPEVGGNGDVKFFTPDISGGGKHVPAATFLRDNCQNGFAPEIIAGPDGDFLRLSVAKGAYGAAQGGEPLKYDRCELRDTKILIGTPVAYAFDMRVARPLRGVEARLVCAQIKAPYYDPVGGSPLFALRVDAGRYIATVEHLFQNGEQHFLSHNCGGGDCPGGAARALDHSVLPNDLGRDFQELQVRALLAKDGGPLPPHIVCGFTSCTTGVRLYPGDVDLPRDIYEWHRFEIRVAGPARKDEDGVLELYVYGALAAAVTGELGHSELKFPNGDPAVHQYFKIGPYRDKVSAWDADKASLDFRNITRRAWAEAAEWTAGNDPPGVQARTAMV